MKKLFLFCITLMASLTFKPSLIALEHQLSFEDENVSYFNIAWKIHRDTLQCTIKYDESLTLPQKFYFYADDTSQMVELPFFPEKNYELYTSQGEEIETINCKLYMFNEPSLNCLGVVNEVTANDEELEVATTEDIIEDVVIEIQKQPTVMINYDKRTVTLHFKRLLN